MKMCRREALWDFMQYVLGLQRLLLIAREGNVFHRHLSFCPQSASLLLVDCSSLLQGGRYASYWNAFSSCWLFVYPRQPATLRHDAIFVTARKQSLGQGNVFTPVCQSFCSQGESAPPVQTLPPPRWQVKRVVRILLECILVFVTSYSGSGILTAQSEIAYLFLECDQRQRKRRKKKDSGITQKNAQILKCHQMEIWP